MSVSRFFQNIFKAILAIILLPILYSCVVEFYQHIHSYPNIEESFFFFGVTTFILVFVFIYSFHGLFEAGQRIILGIVYFLGSLDQFITSVVPFYTMIVLIMYYLVNLFFNTGKYDHYFLFFSGFFLSMHVVLSAQDLRAKEHSVFKPTYIFSIGLTIILNVFALVLFFDLLTYNFTFPQFFTSIVDMTQGIYVDVWSKFLSFR